MLELRIGSDPNDCTSHVLTNGGQQAAKSSTAHATGEVQEELVKAKLKEVHVGKQQSLTLFKIMKRARDSLPNGAHDRIHGIKGRRKIVARFDPGPDGYWTELALQMITRVVQILRALGSKAKLLAVFDGAYAARSLVAGRSKNFSMTQKKSGVQANNKFGTSGRT